MTTATKKPSKSADRYMAWLTSSDRKDGGMSFGDWLKQGAENYTPEPDDCWTCRGTGMGQTDGTRCHSCKGRGY